MGFILGTCWASLHHARVLSKIETVLPKSKPVGCDGNDNRVARRGVDGM